MVIAPHQERAPGQNAVRDRIAGEARAVTRIAVGEA
jgi:hypothetical protein